MDLNEHAMRFNISSILLLKRTPLIFTWIHVFSLRSLFTRSQLLRSPLYYESNLQPKLSSHSLGRGKRQISVDLLVLSNIHVLQILGVNFQTLMTMFTLSRYENKYHCIFNFRSSQCMALYNGQNKRHRNIAHVKNFIQLILIYRFIWNWYT